MALLSFPSLKSANSLDWKVLPILSTVHFGDSLNVAQNIVISDTSLTSFSGFIANDLKTLDINNNRFLESITATVENITESLHIASNSENLNVNLSSLKFANNLTIHEASKLELSNLENVENSASFLNNNFKQLKLPKLKGIGGTLRVSKNPNLSQIELPQVDEIGGGLVVINNTNIEKINFLPNLSIIGGAIELMGNIKEIQLKSLKLVKGSARIKSLTSSFDCSKWTTSEIGSTIRGSRIECTNSDDVKFVTEQNSNSDEDTQSPFDDYSENGENDGERGLASKYFKSESGSTMFIASKWILLFTTSINYLILYNL